MLLFATGIFVVAVLFLGFVSNIQLKEVVANNLEIDKTLIAQQLNDVSLCSFESIAIPEKISYGFGLAQLPYDLVFTKDTYGDKELLSISMNEHGKSNIIDARKLEINAHITLISPDFIQEDEPISGDDLKEEIVLYPRASIKNNQAPADSFVALKEVVGGKTYLYIIPCSSQRKEIPSNCVMNILRAGCYFLSQKSPSANDVVTECFDITREISETGIRTQGMTWKNCQDEFGYK